MATLVGIFIGRFPKRAPAGPLGEITGSGPRLGALEHRRWGTFGRSFPVACGLLLMILSGCLRPVGEPNNRPAAIWAKDLGGLDAGLAVAAEQTTGVAELEAALAEAVAPEASTSASGIAQLEEAPEPEPVVKGPPVTNVWVDADLRAVLGDVAAQTGILIIPDSTVDGVVSLEVQDMPLEECLDRIAETGPWGYRKVQDYYIFASTAPGSRLVDVLGPAKRIKLNFAEATEVHALLPRSLAQYVQVGKKTNTLAVAAPKPAFRRILERVAEFDVPPKQVVVEVLVVQLSEKGRKELGIDWQWQQNTTTVGLDSLLGTFSYNAASSLAQQISITLKALILKDEAKMLANPRLVALDRQQASIYVGQEKYYSLLSGYADRPYYTLESIKAGVTLKITPYIGDNDNITLEIEPEVSEVATNWDSNGSNLPVINKRTARTTVRTKNGQTIIIGGLLHEEQTKVNEKVPILGDIPLLGLLFQKTKDVSEQTEVVIFITPRLITDAYAKKSLQERRRFKPLGRN